MITRIASTRNNLCRNSRLQETKQAICLISSCECKESTRADSLSCMTSVTLMARYTNNKHILVATDYSTKWAEFKSVRMNTSNVTARFLYELIFARFGYPLGIVSDQGTHFINDVINILMNNYIVKHPVSTPYYPQGELGKTNP